MKTFARRDSATSVLRKLGIDKSDYLMFISMTDDMTFEVDVDRAKAYAAERSQELINRLHGAKLETAPAEAEPKNEDDIDVVVTKKVKAPKEPKVAMVRITVASRARELITQGWCNGVVFEALKAQFNLTDDKKHYPSWYRSQMKRLAK